MDEKTRSDLLQSINRNLEILIALFLRMPPGEQTPTMREQIVVLRELNARPRDIARVLGKSESYVNKELTLIRKSTTRKESR